MPRGPYEVVIRQDWEPCFDLQRLTRALVPNSIQKNDLAELKKRNVTSPVLTESCLLRPSLVCNRVTKLEDVVRILCFGRRIDLLLLSSGVPFGEKSDAAGCGESTFSRSVLGASAAEGSSPCSELDALSS